ncbi:MAG: hypothetical protein IKQ92_04140 [Clostridia bacterium]|nr:hypothetical protein [Clostridia bacterium]
MKTTRRAKKALCLLTALLMLLPVFAACSESKENTDGEKAGTDAPAVSSDNTAPEETEEETEPDPFAGRSYNGRSFRVSSSTNDAESTLVSSNYLIEGPEELVGDAAPDEAFQRNKRVEELLDISLEFTGVNYGYGDVGNYIRHFVTTADDAYDCFINDIYGTTSLTVEGAFHNGLDFENFDFSKPWWYEDFMRDISFNYQYQFALAGDFFIDVLRSSHILILNKSLYADIYGNPDEMYDIVLAGDWTYDRMCAMIEEVYSDLNGNQKADGDDRYAYVCYQIWGPMIPHLISADPGFVERDEQGYPTFTVYNERTLKLIDYLEVLFMGPYCGVQDVFQGGTSADMNFATGKSLFIGSQRLGSLEHSTFRDMEYDIGVVPYPTMEPGGKYITSAHDTSEVGLIPVTVPLDDFDFVSAAIEVLNRETNKTVLPVYYESSLKLKYTRDQMSARMIDIIHDNIGNSFPLAWSNQFDGMLLFKIYEAIVDNGGDYASYYKRAEKAQTKILAKMIEKFEKNNHVGE